MPLKRLIDRKIDRLRRWLGPALGAIRGHLNAEELLRVAVVALASGGSLGAVAHAIVANLGTILVGLGPDDRALISSAIAGAATAAVALAEISRRLNHGRSPAR